MRCQHFSIHSSKFMLCGKKCAMYKCPNLTKPSTHCYQSILKFQGSSFNSFFRCFARNISLKCFQRAITQERGIILIRKKICVIYFFKRNPHMNFQSPSMHSSKLMLCIKKHNTWMQAHPGAWTDGRMNQKQYAPPTPLKLGA